MGGITEGHSHNLLGFIHVDRARDQDLSEQYIAEVSCLYLDPLYFRQGLGTRLIEHAFAYLKAKLYQSVVVWVVKKNDRAIQFYQQFNYEPDGKEQVDPKDGLVEVRLRTCL